MNRHFTRARVLVVDDDPVFRNPLRVVLAAHGFDVRIAESGEAAEALLARDPVDVVLSDLGLPGMDGVTLALRHPDTPFVLMTGSPPADPAAALPPAVRARLLKPLDVPRLLVVLDDAVGGRPPAGEACSAVSGTSAVNP